MRVLMFAPLILSAVLAEELIMMPAYGSCAWFLHGTLVMMQPILS